MTLQSDSRGGGAQPGSPKRPGRRQSRLPQDECQFQAHGRQPVGFFYFTQSSQSKQTANFAQAATSARRSIHRTPARPMRAGSALLHPHNRPLTTHDVRLPRHTDLHAGPTARRTPPGDGRSGGRRRGVGDRRHERGGQLLAVCIADVRLALDPAAGPRNPHAEFLPDRRA